MTGGNSSRGSVRATTWRPAAAVALWYERPLRLLDPTSEDEHLGSWPTSDEQDIAAWLRSRHDGGTFAVRMGGAQGSAEQREPFAPASAGQVRDIAKSSQLFGLDQAIVARGLLDATNLVLANPTCPPGLRSRVRHPYDAATVELAVRASSPHVERARLRRKLAELDADQQADLLARIPGRLLEARRSCGLISSDDFIRGDLQGVDVSDRQLAAAAFGPSHAWRRAGAPPALVELLLHHPRPTSWRGCSRRGPRAALRPTRPASCSTVPPAVSPGPRSGICHPSSSPPPTRRSPPSAVTAGL